MITKKEIISEAAGRLGMTKKDMANVFDTLQDCVYDAIATQDTVKLFDGMIFEVKDTNPRTGRNPQTGEAISIPAGKKLSVRFGKPVKDMLKGLSK